MKDFFTTISIWTGSTVAILTIVDWLLTESQKKSVKGWAEHAWLWLGDQKMGRFISYLKSYKIQFVLSTTACILLNMIAYRFFLQSPLISLFGFNLVALIILINVALVAWIIHSRIVLWVVNSDTLDEFFFRCIYVWLISFGTTFFLTLVEIQFVMAEIRSLLVWVPFLLLMTISAETSLIFQVVFLSLLWYCLILLLMTLFRVTQFILFRIVENPKGPVLGISGFLIGIGALVKVFL